MGAEQPAPPGCRGRARLSGEHWSAADRCEIHRQYLARGATDQTIDCFVDLGWRYWRSAERYLADGQSWFEVLPATSRQPLNALHITPAARP
ncbi:hypothetical protein WKI65_38415 [Streptomyces sp. MS1.AVA.3]|uniref:hypothetical protein n=1 Tax=Streptomyces decoyicus TaxID=249567 RepID=UPI0030C16C47